MKRSENGDELLLKLDKIDPMTLYGVGDEYLRIIEKHYPVQLIARGDQLKIRGNSSDIEQVENIVSELIFIANRNGHIRREDVETILHVIKADYSSRNGDEDHPPVSMRGKELDEVVLFTKKGYIKPRTDGQQKVTDAIKQHDLVVVIGPAGTGKTYMAVAFAVAALKEKRVKKIVLARPAVEAGESLGYLPGDYKEKIDPYLRPLYDSLEEMLPKEQLLKYTEQGIIEVIPLAFMRGRTLNNAFVILDEAQNATSMQMKMFLTRLGVNSKAVINGDVTQIDLPDKSVSGLFEIQSILKGIDGIEFIYFEKGDVVRHRLVRDIIHAYDKHSKKNNNDKGDDNE